MEEPFLYKDEQPLKISAEVVFATVKAIIASGKEDDFLKVAKENDAFVTVDAQFINLVKRYIFSQGAHKLDAGARAIVTSATCPG